MADQFFYMDDSGNQHGPLDRSGLAAMVELGDIHAATRVKSAESSKWVLAGSVDWLGLSPATASPAQIPGIPGVDGSVPINPVMIKIGAGVAAALLLLIVVASISGNGSAGRSEGDGNAIDQEQLAGHYQAMKASFDLFNEGIEEGDRDAVLKGWTEYTDAWEGVASEAAAFELLPDELIEEKREELNKYLRVTPIITMKYIKRLNPPLARTLDTPEYYAKCERQYDRLFDARMSCNELMESLKTRSETMRIATSSNLRHLVTAVSSYSRDWRGEVPLKDGQVDWDMIVDYMPEGVTVDEAFQDYWGNPIKFTFLDYRGDEIESVAEWKVGHFGWRATSYGADGRPGGEGLDRDIVLDGG
ncbi:MAG: GYF domain-containing protein [Phycisphaerales bacterium]|nr:GYF domain-containing protein [Phycisphaerales bacterium]